MHTSALLTLALLAATLTANASAKSSNEIEETKHRRIVKRDAAVIIEHIPVKPHYRSDSPVIYKRITRRRYNPKPRYGPPKSKYRSTKPRKPYKKSKKPSTKYGPPGRKKRPSKPRYGPPKSRKPVYGPPKQPYNYEPETHWNYEDAASNFEQTYEKPSFGEPPVDYGAYASSSNTYTQKYKPNDYEGTNYYTNDNIDTDESDNYNDPDYHFAPSKKKPVYVKPEYIDDYIPEDIDPDLLRLIKSKTRPERKKPSKKQQRKPWRPTTPEPTEEEDEEVVGGQYAEPPGRFVPKYSSDPNFDDTDFSPMHFYMNPDRVSTMSSYVNYKNSNMAFSPQNLNDAFSIVQ